MFCIECGQQLPDTAHYCFKCGAKTVQQNDTAINTQHSNDIVAAKAAEFVVEDSSISVVNSNVDDVALKAAFIGGNMPDLPRDIEPAVENVHVSQKNKPRYTETREALLVNYLYKIKREDNIENKVSYSLWNSKSTQQSEWFDDIWCEENGIYGVKLDGRVGLMEKSLQKYFLWESLISIQPGLYGILEQEDKDWILVIAENGIIQFSQYFFDDIIQNNNGSVVVSKNGKWVFFNYNTRKHQIVYILRDIDEIGICQDGIFIVKQNNKYGYIFYNRTTKTYNYMIRCILDAAGSFGIGYENGLEMAAVKYNGKSYLLDKNCKLWEKLPFFNKGLISIGFCSLFVSFIAVIILSEMIREFSWDDIYKTIFSVMAFFIIFILSFMLYSTTVKTLVVTKIDLQNIKE